MNEIYIWKFICHLLNSNMSYLSKVKFQEIIKQFLFDFIIYKTLCIVWILKKEEEKKEITGNITEE